jgi:hypothetical protein
MSSTDDVSSTSASDNSCDDSSTNSSEINSEVESFNKPTINKSDISRKSFNSCFDKHKDNFVDLKNGLKLFLQQAISCIGPKANYLGLEISQPSLLMQAGDIFIINGEYWVFLSVWYNEENKVIGFLSYEWFKKIFNQEGNIIK